MKKLISLALVLCMAVMLLPALAEGADIAGEWIASFAGQTIPMTLNADGTFSMSGAEGTWTLEGETLSMTAQGETMTFTYKDDVISTSEMGQTLEFKRADAGEAAPAEETPAEGTPAEEKVEEITFADVNPAAAADDFSGEWSIQYIATSEGVHANDTGEVSADIAIRDGGITFGSGTGFSDIFGDKALKMEFADGAFSYSRSILGISFSIKVEMLQDGMVAATIDISGNAATLYMVRIEAAAEEPAA